MTESVQWVEVDSGFYTAHRAGVFLGCIDTVPRGFVVLRGDGAPLGRYVELDAARDALVASHPAPAATDAPRPRLTSSSLAAALAALSPVRRQSLS